VKKSTPGRAVLEAMEAAETRARELRLKELEYSTEEVAAHNVALRKELEASYLSDLGGAGADELKARVASLVTILQERTRYEALRISEALRRAEEESARKTNKLLQEQQDVLSREVEQHKQTVTLSEQRAREEALTLIQAQLEEKYEEQLRVRMAEMERLMQQELKRQELEFNAAVSDKVADITKSRADAFALLQDECERLRASIAHTQAADAKSMEVHKITAAALALAQKFETSEPFAKEAGALASISAGAGAPMAEMVQQLPPSAAKKGIPTLPQLQYRFGRVKAAARHEANVPPEMPGFGGQLVASATTFLTVTPKGLVKGDGAEERLARATYYVETGDLAQAAGEIAGLSGRAKAAANDWLEQAQWRLKADQVSAAIRLHAASLNQRQVSG